ncbi:CobW family GTP-binding protein [Desulfospira joergensenii]|uniref:CobW family GTP-binding protein n=1 Tax=Desulfospira joergensenii TaxID=53329 RepID=UPI0003B34FBF|nr:GTP-binding protein [Desulfospira joergensenii]
MIVDIIYGFLGAGKTTFIVNALNELGEDEKTVVLVNEFGEVGIDGGLLERQGGNVVEMPSGCICCTLQTDFRSQLLEITRDLQPERVIIEPTGVATIKQIHSIVGAQLFENTIEKTHSIMIADAAGFMELYKANRHFMESQVENADLVLLNKCDRVDKRSAQLTRSAISAINPGTTIIMTEFGIVDWAEYRQALSTVPSKEFFQPNGIQPHLPHHHEEEEELGYRSFGKIFREESFDEKALQSFFQELNTPDSGMGKIVRAKGIFQISDKWLLMELASGDISSQPLKRSEESRVSIIGNDLNQDLIMNSLGNCVNST